MKLDYLSSTTKPHAQEAVQPAHGGAESRIRRVGEVERSDADRDQSLPQQLAQGNPGIAETVSGQDAAARRTREVVAKLLRLGPQAKRLVKAGIPKRYLQVDEKA